MCGLAEVKVLTVTQHHHDVRSRCSSLLLDQLIRRVLSATSHHTACDNLWADWKLASDLQFPASVVPVG